MEKKGQRPVMTLLMTEKEESKFKGKTVESRRKLSQEIYMEKEGEREFIRSPKTRSSQDSDDPMEKRNDGNRHRTAAPREKRQLPSCREKDKRKRFYWTKAKANGHQFIIPCRLKKLAITDRQS